MDRGASDRGAAEAAAAAAPVLGDGQRCRQRAQQERGQDGPNMVASKRAHWRFLAASHQL
jgi:hypothetical protein